MGSFSSTRFDARLKDRTPKRRESDALTERLGQKGAPAGGCGGRHRGPRGCAGRERGARAHGLRGPRGPLRPVTAPARRRALVRCASRTKTRCSGSSRRDEIPSFFSGRVRVDIFHSYSRSWELLPTRAQKNFSKSWLWMVRNLSFSDATVFSFLFRETLTRRNRTEDDLFVVLHSGGSLAMKQTAIYSF